MPPASSRSTPSRRPPRPIVSEHPKVCVAAARISIPAGIRRTRSGSSARRCATWSAGASPRTCNARCSAPGSSTGPTIRRSEAALPPTATAASGRGTSSSSKTPAACTRIAAISAADGGSERRYSSARWPEPSRKEAHQETPPSTVPTAISVEPPPTSTTPTTPSRSRPSVRVAPTKASRASSSPSRIVTSTPPRSLTTSTNSSRLAALRIAAVATVRTGCAPAASASSRWEATTAPTSSILARGISAPGLRPLPIRVKARRWRTSWSRPSLASATSTRVVFEPMSMQPQTTAGCCQRLHPAGALTQMAAFRAAWWMP